MSIHSLNELNFSAGPGALPAPVLAQLQMAIQAIPDLGVSVLGVSHRSDWFAGVMAEVESNLRDLMQLPDSYRVLLLQGGATQQFSMIPMTWLKGAKVAADYLHTGYWSGKSIQDARHQGPVRLVWQGQSNGFRQLPEEDALSFCAEAPYLHYVSNETVEGLQFHRILGNDRVPRICDMSSDFLSAPVDFARFSLIYAHAQKNLGPAGVTVVVVKDDLLDRATGDLPGFLDYRAQIEARSIYNTPPVFAIYAVLLVTRWLRDEIGGLAAMGQINARKAEAMYQAIDRSEGFYQGRAAMKDRSQMNVVFNLANPHQEARFLAEAEEAGMSGLAGHRSIGGIRASLYNGLGLSAVHRLVDFMDEFRRR